ncbi:uncharacterized protein LOC141685098 [Apium graveolens]|uniref:uncharacterized protein LOC141685098 n=1 Tax=Apium graveolens TaxID=4045 RepID=UPI003D790188
MSSADDNNQATIVNNHDPSSVYYIHSSDASSIQLVSVKFDGNGFNNWKRSMLLVLSAKNKIGFVDGTIEAPNKASPEFKFWSRCNDLVISWIIFNLDATITKSVLFLQTAREIWSDLEERYGYASMTEVYSLEQSLSGIVQDVNLLPYCSCKKCTCNLTKKIQDRQQDQKLLQFMMKLNDKFVAVRANILMMHHLPNMSAAYRLFAQEERHKEISQISNQSESMAFLANRRRDFDSGSYRVGNTSFPNNGSYIIGNTGFPNNKTDYSSTNTENALKGNYSGTKRTVTKPGANYYCTHCKVPGHSIERCYKIHGFPPYFRNKDNRMAACVQSSDDSLTEHEDDVSSFTHTSTQHNNITQEQYVQLMELLNKQHITDTSDSAAEPTSHTALLTGKTCLLSSSKLEWILDIGATDHITNTLDDFCTYTTVSNTDNTIMIPNGNKNSC